MTTHKRIKSTMIIVPALALIVLVAVLAYTLNFFNFSKMNNSADLIGYNGKIYTVDSSFSMAEAFAVKDGKFIAVGKTEDILKKYKASKMVDFKGAAVYPGLNDAHCHLFEMGKDQSYVDLRGSKSFDEVIERLKKYYSSHPDRKFIIGSGWDQNLWSVQEFPTNEKLNKAFPKVPVVLSRIDFHAVVANQAAIDVVGIKPEGKNYLRSEAKFAKDGKFTGVFMENLCVEFKDKVEIYSRKDLEDVMLAAQKKCFENGLTSVCDAEEDYFVIELMDSLVKAGRLSLKIDAWPLPTEENFKNLTKPFRHKNLSVGTFKLYRDGALGSRGALLYEPYSDDKSTKGLEYYPLETYRKYCKWCYDHGFRVATHCIGDAANGQALKVYAEFLKGKNNRGWRIEHAQIVDDRDIDMFSKYSIIPSVQPTHCTSDMLWATERLGKRMKNGYRYKDLLHQLGWIPSGTDFPIESVNPIYTFFAAVYRKNLDFVPAGGFQMENALTKEEALRSMTIWGAKSTFEDKVKGSIEPGKDADFVTTDRDFMQVPEKQVPATKVTGTWLNGAKVF